MAGVHPLIEVPSLARALGLLTAGPGPGTPQPGAPARGGSRAVPGTSQPGAAGGHGSHAGPVVLDVRWRLAGPPGIDSYREGHIPGAVFLDLDRELCGAPGTAGRHPLPAAAAFQRVMRNAGVSTGRHVVVYDDADSTAAARAWWTLRYFGHDAVQVLDGGFRAWTAAGQPAEAGDGPGPAVPPGDFAARPGGMPLLDAAAAGRLARRGVLLDARAAERYRGEVEPVDPVAGHIPGAVSAPAAGNVAGEGVFRRPEELRARFAGLGLAAGSSGETEVGAYCGSGVVASHEVLALSLAGIPAALYAGSWSDWVSDPSRPVAAGPRPG